MKLNHRTASIFTSFVGLALLALSLTHLTHGLNMITGDHMALSFLLALGIDAGMVAFKVAAVVAHDRPVWQEIKSWNTAGLVACLGISGLLNILSYTHGKDWGFDYCISMLLGAFIPLTVYALSQVSTKLWLMGHKRSTGTRKPARKKK